MEGLLSSSPSFSAVGDVCREWGCLLAAGCGGLDSDIEAFEFIRFVYRECWLSCGIILLQLWLTPLWCGIWCRAPRRFGFCG